MGNKSHSNNDNEKSLDDYLKNNTNDVNRYYNFSDHSVTNYNSNTCSRDIKNENLTLKELEIPFKLESEELKFATINNKLSINITITSKSDFALEYYFLADIDKQPNNITKFKSISNDKNYLSINKCDNKKIEITFNNLTEYPLEYFYKTSTIPLVLILSDLNIKLSIYYEYILKNNQLFLSKKYILYNGNYYKLKNIYGISNSIVSNKDDKELCCICLTNLVNTIIKPCMHLIMCDVCSQDLIKNQINCPKCRNKIDSFILIS